MEFDKNRLMDNINCLIKEKNLRIGEVEAEVGISKGYLSRMSKEENDTIPTVDLIWNLAQKLGTSVDMLVGGDFSKVNDNLFFIMKYVYKLKTMTDLHDIEWRRVPKAFYEAVERGMQTHPLFVDNERDLRSLFPEEQQENAGGVTQRYNSSFVMSPVTVFDDCFEGTIPGFGMVYIMELFYNSKDEGAVPYTEIVMIEYGDEDAGYGDATTPICATLGKSQELRPSINELITCIKRHEADVQLNQQQKGVISRFLKFGEEEELPFN